ncbi:MAG TPA: dihydrofolate reductase family protein [Chloroflexota bacterium]|nr:dihydrofolate reductase family protein [Chloroflexota bacterium]
MRDIVVSTFVTLDGVMQAPGGPEEDPSGGFAHGGWSGGYWDDVVARAMGESMSKPFDLLLGRRTYEIFAAYWPHATAEEGAAALNNATKYVVSTTLAQAEWQHSTVIRPGERDVPEQIRRLKEQDGPELQVHGSSRLIQTLIAHDLVDRYFLKVYPVLLGTGKRLFGEGAVPAGLRLVGSTTSTTGVVIATYERAGEIRYGSFAPESSAPR